MGGEGSGRRKATDEERAAARTATYAKVKTISLDADIVDTLNAMADKLGAELGFRPTLTQTVRHLIRKAT